MAASGSRSRVVARTARPDDLPAVLALVRQYRTDALAEGVLTGQTPLDAAAGGFGRLLADPGHRVVLAVLPGAAAPAGDQGADGGEVAVGLAILGTDPLSTVLGSPQVTVDTFVVHRAHRRKGAGAALLGAAAAYAQEVGAAHLVAAVGGHEAERQRFLARMGFAPLTARRIVAVETLTRSLASWRRGALAPPLLRRAPSRRRSAPLRGLPTLDTLAAEG
ncbi:GNAT family N-acetyltransferase [Geodermatophilus sp. YIM 151500]|uniref:GNAT family N-acetyltransferase n=1 Tax=Geodermatophilus sp. YIM 151500 TaxID=2984531 RepID=UPI0021E3AAD1|nr:GNAT family N-acetyltransferase [Geodermatophilus sp. YIM 151500]MCV2491406.1 GNAT family N-acetyltransferase [Geodermatophilus sp. YIM 151500]